ncbi:unnamed protein product, partial [marine sediment metagenome]
RALVEATSFGAKAIVERFSQENIIISNFQNWERMSG